MEWYYALNAEKTGPVSQEKILELARVGTVTATTLVWHEGMDNWAQWSVAGQGLTWVGDASTLEDSAPCAECRHVTAKSEMIFLDGNWICALCKPLVVQRMREGVAPISGGIWRSRKSLVISLAATFPERCVKCNQPTTNGQLKQKLYWHHPAVYLALFLNVIIYVIIAMCVRKKAFATISVCPKHRQQRRIAIALGWILGPGGILILTVGGQNNILWLVPVGIIVSLFGLIYGIMRGRLIRATKINKENVWVSGCCPAFMAEFPEWNG